jgi:hypothetical protein
MTSQEEEEAHERHTCAVQLRVARRAAARPARISDDDETNQPTSRAFIAALKYRLPPATVASLEDDRDIPPPLDLSARETPVRSAVKRPIESLSVVPASKRVRFKEQMLVD